MSVLSNMQKSQPAISKSVKGGKSAKESSMKNNKRVIVRLRHRVNKDGVEFRAWFMGVLTNPKNQLTEDEQQALLSKFCGRVPDENGKSARRTRLIFHCYEDKPGDGVRAWIWLTDVTMATPAQVKAWVTGALKPAKAPGKVYEGTVVDETPSKKHATKVARSQKAAPAKKQVASKVEVEYSIA